MRYKNIFLLRNIFFSLKIKIYIIIKTSAEKNAESNVEIKKDNPVEMIKKRDAIDSGRLYEILNAFFNIVNSNKKRGEIFLPRLKT